MSIILDGTTGITTPDLTDSSLTSGRVVYAGASGNLTGASGLTFDGTNLETTGRLILRTNASPFAAGQFGYSSSGGNYIWAKAGTTGSQDNFFIFDDGGNPAYSINSSRSHIWSVSGSEGMRLTSTGLGIGSTSPTQKLYVSSSGNSQGQFITTGAGGGANRASVILSGPSNTWFLTTNGSDINGTDEALGFYGNSATRMVITNSGNLGIGTTSPAYKLEVATGTSGQQSLASFRTADSTAANNAGVLIFATPSSTATSRSVLLLLDADGANGSGADYFYINKAGNSGNVDLFQQSNAAMTFATNGTERARITSSGNVLIGGTTDLGGKLQVLSTYIRMVDGNSSQGTGFVSSDYAGNEWHFGRNTANGYYYIVTQAGTGQYMITGTSVWLAISDERYKENLVPITDALSKVNTLRTVTGNLISEKNHTKPYLIAQDVQKVLPEAVDSSNPDRLGLAYTDVIPLLVAAIKEQTAIIESLKARLDAANL